MTVTCSTRRAAALAEASLRTVERWVTEQELIRPVRKARGSGDRHRWTEHDVRALRVGVLVNREREGVDHVRRAVECFRAWGCPRDGFLLLTARAAVYTDSTETMVAVVTEGRENVLIVDLSAVSVPASGLPRPSARAELGPGVHRPDAGTPTSGVAPTVPVACDVSSAGVAAPTSATGATPVPERDDAHGHLDGPAAGVTN